MHAATRSRQLRQRCRHSRCGLRPVGADPRTYADLATREGLEFIAGYADGVGVDRTDLISPDAMPAASSRVAERPDVDDAAPTPD